MGDLIKYHNDINNIPLRKLTEKEINLFFSIIYKVKDKGVNQVDFNFSELRKLSNGDTHNKRFIKSLDNMDKKLLQLNQSIEIKEGVFERFNLFNTFRIDTNNKKLEIEIHRNFSYMINNLGKGHFTLLELKQLVELRSSYSKNSFRLMKQWESTKKLEIKLEEFKRILCIPNSYRMRDIDKRVLIPVMEELSPIFQNLKLEKIKNGRKITDLKFTWSRKSLPHGGNTKVLEISEGLNKAIEKAKKNRFIKPLISEENIEKLLNNFSDQELTKGLYLSDKKINREIKSINYIITTIENELKENKLKIVIKKSEYKDLQGVKPKGEVKEELTEEIKELGNVDFGKLFLKTSNQLIKTGKYEKLKGKFETIKEIGVLKEFIKINNLEVKKYD